ncbi:metal ABC transporter permease [Modestobacter versicolor]|uniref:metal ABC transporter permease n=1 Tax=Modestobacter versicolor TaxID=429133 RepID=UPI0034DF6231
MTEVFSFEDYGRLLALVHGSLVAAALLGVIGGLVGVFVQMRDMQFAVHGISELSFAGAAGALLLGVNVALGSVLGSLLAGLLIGLLGVRARDRNSVIGVLMPFGLGLGVLFLALYDGRAANKFGLLTGQVVSVGTVQLGWLAGLSVVVLGGLALIWRPLTFVSADPEVAAARGMPAGPLSVVFTLLLALAVSVAVQVIGALLVLALLVTPAAAALRVTASPVLAPLLSAAFGVVSAVGGILVALGTSVPISPFVTTISFLIYLVCRVASGRRARRGWGSRDVHPAPAEEAVDNSSHMSLR